MLRSVPCGKGFRRLWKQEGAGLPCWPASNDAHDAGNGVWSIWRGCGAGLERPSSSSSTAASLTDQKPHEPPHVVDLLKKAGVDLSDSEGFDQLYGKGPNAKMLMDSLEPKVDLLRKFGFTEARSLEGVLRRFDSKWMLQPNNTSTMRKNLKYLENQLHFPRVGIKSLVLSNPFVLTEKMKVKGSECIVSMLAKHFGITLMQFQHLAIFHPELLTYNPERVPRLRFWLKKVGVGPEEKCRVVRKEPRLLGMDVRQGCEMDQNLAELRKALDKDVDMNGNEEKVRAQRTAKVFASAPRIVMEGHILPKFIETMKEHNLNESICAKVLGRCTYIAVKVEEHLEIARKLNFLLKVLQRHIRDVVRHGGVLGQSMDDLIFPRFGYLKQLGLKQSSFQISDIVMSTDAQFARLHDAITMDGYRDFVKDFKAPDNWVTPRM